MSSGKELQLRISAIGAGAMATAIISGLVKSGYPPENAKAFDISEAALAKFAKASGAAMAKTPEEALDGADVVLIAVKPQSVHAALSSIREIIKGRLVISIAAGVNIARLEKESGTRRVIRAMPNTPALVGEGITAIAISEDVGSQDQSTAQSIFSSVGKTVFVSEKMMDAVTGLSGSGPAYVFDFIQALSDAGVNNGLSRDVAFKLASQTVYGASRLLIESGEHPSILKENVTSPGGTTAKGLAVLERGAFRGIISEAVTAATERSRELGRD